MSQLPLLCSERMASCKRRVLGTGIVGTQTGSSWVRKRKEAIEGRETHMDARLQERLLWPALEEQPESRVGTVKTGLIETPELKEPKEDAGRICRIHQAS